jgi:hypothetical protein
LKTLQQLVNNVLFNANVILDNLSSTKKESQDLPKSTAANLSCASGYFGKNLYSSNKFEIMQLKIDCSLFTHNFIKSTSVNDYNSKTSNPKMQSIVS